MLKIFLLSFLLFITSISFAQHDLDPTGYTDPINEIQYSKTINLDIISSTPIIEAEELVIDDFAGTLSKESSSNSNNNDNPQMAKQSLKTGGNIKFTKIRKIITIPLSYQIKKDFGISLTIPVIRTLDYKSRYHWGDITGLLKHKYIKNGFKFNSLIVFKLPTGNYNYGTGTNTLDFSFSEIIIKKSPIQLLQDLYFLGAFTYSFKGSFNIDLVPVSPSNSTEIPSLEVNPGNSLSLSVGASFKMYNELTTVARIRLNSNFTDKADQLSDPTGSLVINKLVEQKNELTTIDLLLSHIYDVLGVEVTPKVIIPLSTFINLDDSFLTNAQKDYVKLPRELIFSVGTNLKF